MTVHEAALLFYPIVLLIIMLKGAKLSKRGDFSDDFLNLDQSKQIQAAACIAIMIHHVAQHITNYGNVHKGPITLFNYIGFLFTAVFFFFSGYGLFTSLLKKENYLDNFLIKRIVTVLVPFWLINMLIVIIDKYYRGVRLSAPDVVKSLIGIRLVNSNGWFMIEIVILYLLFYSIFSLIKNRDVALGFMCFAVLAIIAYSFFQGHDMDSRKVHWFKGEWWYNSTITFAYGLVYARFKDRIETFIKKHYLVCTIIFTLLTVVMTIATINSLKYLGYYHELAYGGRKDALITLVIQSVNCLVSITLVLLLGMRISLDSKILKYIGSMLLPLFLIHGYIVNTLLSNIVVNDFFRFAIVIFSSIAATAIIAPGINFLVEKIRKVTITIPHMVVNDTLEARLHEKRKEISLKRTRITAIIIISLVILFGGAFFVARQIIFAKEYKEEVTNLNEANVGDKVFFGHFDTESSKPGKERMTWIVVKKQEDKICLLSEYGIASSWYNQQHKEVTWESSDIREFINSEKFTKMFTTEEIELIEKSNGDFLSLLTASEALELFETDKDRELVITDVAEKNGANKNTPSKVNSWDMKGYRSSWWWLRGENEEGKITAPIVTVDGTVVIDEKVVNKPGGAIRPVIWILLR